MAGLWLAGVELRHKHPAAQTAAGDHLHRVIERSAGSNPAPDGTAGVGRRFMQQRRSVCACGRSLLLRQVLSRDAAARDEPGGGGRATQRGAGALRHRGPRLLHIQLPAEARGMSGQSHLHGRPLRSVDEWLMLIGSVSVNVGKSKA